MKTYNSDFLHKLTTGMIIIAFFSLVSLWIWSGSRENVVVTGRAVEEAAQAIHTITDYRYETRKNADAPIGMEHIYYFTVPKTLEHDTCLAFYLFHQYANVYLEEECVYRLESSKELSMIQTPGYNWATIPIYVSDAGKELRVEIIPVYGGMDDEKTEFFMGPKDQIVLRQLKQSWFKLTLCELLIFTGLVLIPFSIYYRKRYHTGIEITAFGILSLFTGLWRYADSKFMPFLFPEKPVFFFLLSFSMMMMGMIPLMISQRSNVNRTLRFAYNLLVSAFCVLAAILQWMGILEVRNFIRIFHMIACVGFMMVLYPIFSSWKSCKNKRKIDWKMIGILILIMGIAMDGFFFYVHRTSARTIFWLLGVLIYIIVAAFSFMLNFRKQIFLNEKKEKELINSRITSMMSQIRSHMIFNVLNAISGMCKYDPEKADETIVCFARYLRANVDILDNDHLVPFRGVLSQLEDYIALEKVRFGDRICFEKCLEIEDFMMPSLILQPIVENAIRHGILPKGEPGTITLHTLNARDEIQIVLSDDGIGFDTESLLQKRESVGLKNIRLRLQYMMNGKIEVKSTKGKGTTVTIFLPINH